MKYCQYLFLAIICLFANPLFAQDQCDTTAQCKSIHGSTATDCLNSKTNRSVCMCGENECSSGKPGGNNNGGGKTAFSMNFNDLRSGSSLPRGSGAARRYSKVSSNCGPDRSNCLVTKYRPADNGSARQGAKYGLKPSSEYTLQFDVRFDDNFQFVKGGKLHGLGPDQWTTGCRPQVANGWSARMMWGRDARATLYIYDQSRARARKHCGWSYSSKSNVLKRGKWQAISLYVKLNSVGKSNGLAELWVDGKREARKSGIKFRGSNRNSLISRFGFSTFFGGGNASWSPSKTVGMKTDNYRVVKGRSIRNKAGK